MRYAGGNSEVLVDVNAHTAATALKFTIARWDSQGTATPQNTAYFAWVKSQLAAGYPVVGAVYSVQGNFDGALTCCGSCGP